MTDEIIPSAPHKKFEDIKKIDENGIATVYRGGNVSENKLKDLRYNDYLSSVKEGKDITGNAGASEYGKNIVELKIPIKDLKIENGELRYIGESKSLTGGVKYPQNFYKEYNDYHGSNLTAKEIDGQSDVWDTAKALSGYDIPKTQNQKQGQSSRGLFRCSHITSLLVWYLVL